MSSLEVAIDGFFVGFRDFTKRVEDDVANLRRSLEHGYSLGPHQFRERLKQLERQADEVENALIDLESRTSDRTTLTELSNSCLCVYQATASGIDVLEAHLRNYGYQQDLENKAPFDPMTLLHGIDAQKTKYSTAPATEGLGIVHDALRSSLISAGVATAMKSPLALTQGTCSLLMTEHPMTAVQQRTSLGSFSTLSHDALHCSPGTLALKKKYTMAEASIERGESPSASPVQDDDCDSFEFRPHGLKSKETAMDVDEGEGEGETGFGPGELPRSPLPTTLPIGEADLRSPRLSATGDQRRFGSPFRSPHAKPEKSVFTSPAKNTVRWISAEQYDALPQYLRSTISYERLNDAFHRFHAAELFAHVDFLSQHDLEENAAVGDKFLLQAFVKLGALVRHFSNGIMGYRLNEEWKHYKR